MPLMKTQMIKDPLITKLYWVIGRMGPIAEVHYSALKELVEMKIYSEEKLVEWAKAFTQDQWRRENPQYKTVGHFIRDPERWNIEEVEEEEPWLM